MGKSKKIPEHELINSTIKILSWSEIVSYYVTDDLKLTGYFKKKKYKKEDDACREIEMYCAGSKRWGNTFTIRRRTRKITVKDIIVDMENVLNLYANIFPYFMESKYVMLRLNNSKNGEIKIDYEECDSAKEVYGGVTIAKSKEK